MAGMILDGCLTVTPGRDNRIIFKLLSSSHLYALPFLKANVQLYYYPRKLTL
jgi:hypothetical protein